MRLNRYLTEADKYDNEYIGKKVIMPMLIKNCKPFLIEFLKTQKRGSDTRGDWSSGFKWFWRGTDKQITEIGEVPRRINRKPKDTPKILHDIIDFQFFKKFGWAVRSQGVFTNPSRGKVLPYGAYAYAFFPIGKYRYVWSDRVEDLFAEIYRRNLTPDKADHLYSDVVGNLNVLLPNTKEEYEEERKEFKKWLKDKDGWAAVVIDKSDDIINTFINNKMDRALAHSFEVVFDCKKYFLVEEQYLIHLERNLKA
jgi:hypothetical protein